MDCFKLQYHTISKLFLQEKKKDKDEWRGLWKSSHGSTIITIVLHQHIINKLSEQQLQQASSIHKRNICRTTIFKRHPCNVPDFKFEPAEIEEEAERWERKRELKEMGRTRFLISRVSLLFGPNYVKPNLCYLSAPPTELHPFLMSRLKTFWASWILKPNELVIHTSPIRPWLLHLFSYYIFVNCLVFFKFLIHKNI